MHISEKLVVRILLYVPNMSVVYKTLHLKIYQ